jgi:hypothetical protein
VNVGQLLQVCALLFSREMYGVLYIVTKTQRGTSSVHMVQFVTQHILTHKRLARFLIIPSTKLGSFKFLNFKTVWNVILCMKLWSKCLI